MIHTRYRHIGLAAVAVLFGFVIAGGPAFAATPPDDPGRSASAPGQEKKAEEPTATSDAVSTTTSDAPAAAATASEPEATVAVSASGSASAAASAAPASNGGGNGFGASQAADHGPAADNGNGGGKATGKPCAGCVGNADGKTPKGQSKNDKNRGHECDDNKGIGKGNPAHSPCPTTPPAPNPNPNPNPTTPASVAATTATPAAQVLGVQFERPAQVLGVQVTRGAGLAFTGAATTPLVATAIAMLCMGAALIFLARRDERELVRCASRLAGHIWVSAI